MSTSSISLQSSKSARLLSSHDNCVRSLATSQAYNKSYSNRFSAFREAAKSLSETPGASAAKLSDITKSRLKEEHQKQLLARTKNLHVQGSIFRLENCSSDVWANVVSCLPGHQLSFVLNAVSDTLPSNANLVLWSKRSCDKCPLCHQRQTLLHVLNNCSVLLQCRHYNQRHDSVLSLLYNAAINHLPHQFNIFADLKDCEVKFPSDIIPTAQRPDMLIWNNHTLKFYVIELTIPFETNFFDANKRKSERYTDFMMTIKSKGFTCKQLNIQIGSRGFIDTPSLLPFLDVISIPPHNQRQLLSSIVKVTIKESLKIWLARNNI